VSSHKRNYTHCANQTTHSRSNVVTGVAGSRKSLKDISVEIPKRRLTANAMLRVLFSRLGQPHIGSSNAFSFNVPSVRGSGAITIQQAARTPSSTGSPRSGSAT
jgi:hypothetical protein